MDGAFRTRLVVDVLGVQAWIRDLCLRADHGDEQAEGALLKLREALEAVKELCMDGRDLTVDEYLVLHEEAKILLEAAQGRSSLSREELREVLRQTVEDCKRVGCKLPDEKAFSELIEEYS